MSYARIDVRVVLAACNEGIEFASEHSGIPHDELRSMFGLRKLCLHTPDNYVMVSTNDMLAISSFLKDDNEND